MKKQILKDFELIEISAVDRPAQPTATMAIIKRKTDDEGSPMALTAAEIAEKEKLQKSIKDLEAKLLKTEGSITEITSQLAEATILSKLHDDEKRFRADMDDKAKKAFDLLSDEERKKKMALTKANDEVIKVAGKEVRKSEIGEAMFAIVKSQQESLVTQEKATKKALEAAELTILTKRAGDEFSHLTGTAEEIAGVLKAFEGMPDEVKKTAEGLLSSAEKLAAKAFNREGHRDGNNVIEGSPVDKLDKLAKEYAKENKCDFSKAYVAVIEKHTDLYEASLEGAQ